MTSTIPKQLGCMLNFYPTLGCSLVPPPFSGIVFSGQSDSLTGEAARSDLASQIFVRVQSQSKVYLNKMAALRFRSGHKGISI